MNISTPWDLRGFADSAMGSSKWRQEEESFFQSDSLKIGISQGKAMVRFLNTETGKITQRPYDVIFQCGAVQ
jgi:hypothetical protein